MHIGLFDSGVGGLTVLKTLQEKLPYGRYTYLGDTARLPYGNKAKQTLKKYTHENIDFLDQQGVDAIVIACHSASSVSLDLQNSPHGAPIYNVIDPSCQLAQQTTQNKKVAIIATKATTRSQVYPGVINDLQTDIQVFSQECPLLVPLVEEGLMDDEVTDFILKRYLLPVLQFGADTLILGCTHYPILEAPIRKILGQNVTLINPAEAIADQIQAQCLDKNSQRQEDRIFLSDHAPHFIEHAKSLLPQSNDIEFLFPEEN